MKKQNWIMLGIICILAVVVYFNNKGEKRTEKAEIETSFTGIDTTMVDRFELKSSDGMDVVLVKDDGQWNIIEPIKYPANQTNIDNILKKLVDFKVENIISFKQESHSKFEVDSSKGYPIKIFVNGQQKSHIIMGKNDNDWSHTYVREEGRNEVYLLSENIVNVFKKSLQDWRDKSIVKIDKELARKVSLQVKDSSEVSLVKSDTVWTVASKGLTATAKKGMVAQVLNGLANLNATGFVETDTLNIDFTLPELSLQIEMAGGKQHVVRCVPVPEEDNKYYVQADTNPQIFEIYKTSLSSYMKQYNDFAEPPKAPATEETAPVE